jgi:hypothetical protein
MALVYKAIFKPIWSYGIQLWGSASKSNIEILGEISSKSPLLHYRCPWYVPNSCIVRDLSIMTVQAAIGYHSNKCKARMKLHHPPPARHKISCYSQPLAGLKDLSPAIFQPGFKARVSRKQL